MQKMLIYQVFPRIFGNRNNTKKHRGSLAENGCGKFDDFSAKALKAIKKLGTTHVWFTGVIEHATQTDYSASGIKGSTPSVVKGIAGSPYAIRDYYDVDPDLATNVENRMQEFESLISRTHAVGLKAIIDFVPNHVAREYYSDAKPSGVADFGENDNTSWHFSAQNNFYYFPDNEFSPQFDKGNYEERPAKATGNDCFSPSPNINDWYETVKLNYG
ncbi:MAG: alpha-amylase, partial [Paludibacteraceae bacterium]|nr:alpha-amylase [Paludibacteraceae bacterium]